MTTEKAVDKAMQAAYLRAVRKARWRAEEQANRAFEQMVKNFTP